ANLFGNSVVAVDAATGKYKWHFQVVHHDLWDFDLPPAPGLVDIVKDGRKTPALAQIGKSAYMFILDRVTGKPVFGVEERAVPKGDVPGEWYSPTQPFPVKPTCATAKPAASCGRWIRARRRSIATAASPCGAIS
ncbi:MAG TPA: pyrroloquinoline quinone-dependent dehydrogenase, partial [Xanthobacteraceae bacterium]